MNLPVNLYYYVALHGNLHHFQHFLTNCKDQKQLVGKPKQTSRGTGSKEEEVILHCFKPLSRLLIDL